jgi:hypothetical protein
MRIALRSLMEGSTVLALAVVSAALHYALRSIRTQRVAVASNAEPNRLARRVVIHTRRPVFLSRRDLL